ncbi:hypothetical protein ABH926_004322 [Catenulispora sp. GP43]
MRIRPVCDEGRAHAAALIIDGVPTTRVPSRR